MLTRQASKKSKPAANGKGKGKATDKDAPEVGPTGKPKRKADQPKKIKLRDQKVLPVPETHWAGDEYDSDEDIMDLGEDEELGLEGAGAFLASVDQKALSRWVLV